MKFFLLFASLVALGLLAGCISQAGKEQREQNLIQVAAEEINAIRLNGNLTPAQKGAEIAVIAAKLKRDVDENAARWTGDDWMQFGIWAGTGVLGLLFGGPPLARSIKNAPVGKYFGSPRKQAVEVAKK